MQRSFWSSEVIGLLLIISYLLSSCSVRPAREAVVADYRPVDYSNPSYWSCLPQLKDSADAVPDPSWHDVQAISSVDVFFLHPTTYTGDKGHRAWNADLDDQILNAKTDRTTMWYQASVFNGAGAIYAPRYRQAHLFSYRAGERKPLAMSAFAIAYDDVKNAFTHYLNTWNKGRPFIIASHSQGTQHAVRLIKELIDTTDLRSRFVAGYLIGMPVRKDVFQSIPMCETPHQTGCFCAWRTFREGYLPKSYPIGSEYAVTNPLSWTTRTDKVERTKNPGGVLRKFYDDIHPGITSAQIHRGILWAEKPKFPWSFMITFRNYHIADYNFYYVSLRQNAADRVQAFLEE